MIDCEEPQSSYEGASYFYWLPGQSVLVRRHRYRRDARADRYNPVVFDAVKTDGLRLEVSMQALAAGVEEWKIKLALLRRE
jgi:hypothetical protein